MTLQVTPVGDLNSDTENVPTVAGGSGSSLTILDEGVTLDTAVVSIDHVGAGIVATNVGHAVTVTVAGAPSGDGGGAKRWDWLYGDGADGSATCDGASAVPGMSLAGGNYSMTRACAFADLTVNAGVIVYGDNAGPLFVNGTLTLQPGAGLLAPAIISANRSSTNAVGTSRGTGSAAAFWNAMASGGAVNAAGDTAVLGGANGAIGAAGGSGGNDGTVGSKAGGGLNLPPVSAGGAELSQLLIFAIRGKGTDNVRYGGGSGGGGAGSGTGGGTGGAGGAGGQLMLICARNIVGGGSPKGIFSCAGGNGASGTGTGAQAAGGGGGGGGGVGWLVTETTTAATEWTYTAAGGAGGSGFGTGSGGADGSPGRIQIFITD